MKKLTLSLIVLLSFAIGNISMIVSIFKIFGEDALAPVVKDLIHNKVGTLLYGDAPPRSSPLRGAYGQSLQYARPDLERDGYRVGGHKSKISRTDAVMAGIPLDDPQVQQ